VKSLAPLFPPKPRASVPTIGPWRLVVETVGFYTFRGPQVTYQYVLECGHEVERKQRGLTGAYCSHCRTREGGS
jgi:hypothetical protein